MINTIRPEMARLRKLGVSLDTKLRPLFATQAAKTIEKNIKLEIGMGVRPVDGKKVSTTGNMQNRIKLYFDGTQLRFSSAGYFSRFEDGYTSGSEIVTQAFQNWYSLKLGAQSPPKLGSTVNVHIPPYAFFRKGFRRSAYELERDFVSVTDKLINES